MSENRDTAAPPRVAGADVRSRAVSGLATGLFSISEGTAHAQLAGIGREHLALVGARSTAFARVCTGPRDEIGVDGFITADEVFTAPWSGPGRGESS